MSAPTRPAESVREPVYCETCGDRVHRVEITVAVWEEFEGGGIGPAGQGPPKQPGRVSLPGPTTTKYLPCEHTRLT